MVENVPLISSLKTLKQIISMKLFNTLRIDNSMISLRSIVKLLPVETC